MKIIEEKNIEKIVRNKLELDSDIEIAVSYEERFKGHNSTISHIKVEVNDESTLSLIEKRFTSKSNEPYMYKFLSTKNLNIPQVYFSNSEDYVLMEDISIGYECLGDWDEEGKEYMKRSFPYVVRSLAKFHMLFWEDKNSLHKIDLPWHFQSLENYSKHLEYLNRDLNSFKDNNREKYKEHLKYFDYAYNFLEQNYKEVVKTRFRSKRNMTLVHGDLNAANVWVSKNSTDLSDVIFLDYEAVRMGLPTDDLVMLLTFHFANDKRTAMPLLKEYYALVQEKEYTYNEFLYDFKCSLMDTLFFAIKLINSGIPAYDMIEGFIKTYETFFNE